MAVNLRDRENWGRIRGEGGRLLLFIVYNMYVLKWVAHVWRVVFSIWWTTIIHYYLGGCTTRNKNKKPIESEKIDLYSIARKNMDTNWINSIYREHFNPFFQRESYLMNYFTFLWSLIPHFKNIVAKFQAYCFGKGKDGRKNVYFESYVIIIKVTLSNFHRFTFK